MDPAEVLAVEIKQYVGQELRTLVPRVIGRTAGSDKKRGAPPQIQWDETFFFQEVERRHGEIVATVARRIFEWAKTNMPSISWGKGARSGSFVPGLDHGGVWHQFIGVWTYGNLNVQFQFMQGQPPFDSEAKRTELLRRLNEIPGITLPADSISRRPPIPLSSLSDEAVLNQFLETLNWAVGEVLAS